MRVCAHDDEHFGGPDDAHHAVSVRRQRRLRQLRMHRVGGPGRGRTPHTLGFVPVGAIFTGSVAVGEMMRRRRERTGTTPPTMPAGAEAEPG